LTKRIVMRRSAPSGYGAGIEVRGSSTISLTRYLLIIFTWYSNAQSPMEVTLLGIVTLVKAVPANAPYPMEVTRSGIITLVKDVP
jgi:hypothetical protein